MAFGDVAVETDQPTLPMLSGAGSRTWVEHTLRRRRPTPSIEVGAGDATSTRPPTSPTGVALAGGFRLELPAPAADARPPDRAGAAGRHRAVATPRRPSRPPTAAAEVEATPPAGAARRGARASIPTTRRRARRDPGRGGRRRRSTHGAGRRRSDRRRARRPTATSDEPHDADVTLPPPASGELLGDVVRRGDAGDDAAARSSTPSCAPNGHPNPPTVATCAVCGEFLAPGAAAVVHVPRPSLGHLAARRRRRSSSSTRSCSSGATPTATAGPSAPACAGSRSRRQGLAQPPRGPLPGLGRPRRRLRIDQRHVRRAPPRRPGRRRSSRAGRSCSSRARPCTSARVRSPSLGREGG